MPDSFLLEKSREGKTSASLRDLRSTGEVTSNEFFDFR